MSVKRFVNYVQAGSWLAVLYIATVVVAQNGDPPDSTGKIGSRDTVARGNYIPVSTPDGLLKPTKSPVGAEDVWDAEDIEAEDNMSIPSGEVRGSAAEPPVG